MSIIDGLEATLAAGNDSAQLRFGLASACFREERFADAQQHAAVAVELDPDYSAAWRLLGRANIELGDDAAARSAFEHGIAVAERHGDMQLVREMNVFLRRVSREDAVQAHPIAERLRRFSERTGAAIAWLTLPMVAATFLIALLRYAFAVNWIWLQELVVWMHALVFMLAAAYTLNADEHVRVDIFYRRFSRHRQAWVELLGCVFFLMPICIVMIWMSFDYVFTSWSIGEGSSEVGGLPWPFIPLLKTVIPIAFGLLAVQSIAIMLDAWSTLRRQR